MYKMFFDDGTAVPCKFNLFNDKSTVKPSIYDPFDNGNTAKPFSFEQVIFDPSTNNENTFDYFIHL
ncbi:MAG: hypothetical protein PWQ59_1860 [Thermoanaerobacterium sp.]|nr:hypothetical protein [Thermoanaerobacterium sp.]